MGKIRGFMDYDRADEAYLSVTKRLKNYDEFTIKPCLLYTSPSPRD